jgi:uracil-DNA glycosylase
MVKLSVPEKIKPGRVKIIMICEGLPENDEDYFYSSSSSLYVVNTIAAFNDAGIEVAEVDDIVRKGVYLTVAVKATRTGTTIPSAVIKEHSYALEEELNAFPNVRAMLLMGDAAIKALNFISKRATGKRAIPAGSTYKIRKEEFYYGDIRVFPSYLQTGRNFLIEKSKQRMVAEDIRNAFELVNRREA